MRRPFRTLVLATLCSLALLGPASGQQETPPLVVAVLDIQQVMRDAKAAKAMQAMVEQQRTAFQAELAQQESALRQADQQLAEQRPSLSPDDFRKRRQEIDQQAAALRRNAQARKAQLENLVNSGMNEIRNALIRVVAEIAQERGITLVLSKSQVVLSANAYDITADALSQLDAELPTLDLPGQ